MPVKFGEIYSWKNNSLVVAARTLIPIEHSGLNEHTAPNRKQFRPSATSYILYDEKLHHEKLQIDRNMFIYAVYSDQSGNYCALVRSKGQLKILDFETRIPQEISLPDEFGDDVPARLCASENYIGVVGSHNIALLNRHKQSWQNYKIRHVMFRPSKCILKDQMMYIAYNGACGGQGVYRLSLLDQSPIEIFHEDMLAVRDIDVDNRGYLWILLSGYQFLAHPSKSSPRTQIITLDTNRAKLEPKIEFDTIKPSEDLYRLRYTSAGILTLSEDNGFCLHTNSQPKNLTPSWTPLHNISGFDLLPNNNAAVFTTAGILYYCDLSTGILTHHHLSVSAQEAYEPYEDHKHQLQMPHLLPSNMPLPPRASRSDRGY
jgi:hypothetical protein